MKLVFSILLALSALVFFIPALFSSSFAQKLLASQLAKTHKDLRAESLEFSWLGPQTAKNLSYRDPKGTFFIPELKIEQNLWSLIPLLSCDFYQIQNLGIVQLSHASANYDETQISDLNISCQSSRELSQLDLHITAHIRSEENIAGSFELTAAFQGLYYENKHLELDLNKLPTTSIDLFLKTQGIAARLLGPALDLQATFHDSSEKNICDVSARSKHFQASISAARTQNGIFASSGGYYRLEITPETIQNAFSSLKIDRPIILDGTLDHIEFNPQNIIASTFHIHNAMQPLIIEAFREPFLLESLTCDIDGPLQKASCHLAYKLSQEERQLICTGGLTSLNFIQEKSFSVQSTFKAPDAELKIDAKRIGVEPLSLSFEEDFVATFCYKTFPTLQVRCSPQKIDFRNPEATATASFASGPIANMHYLKQKASWSVDTTHIKSQGFVTLLDTAEINCEIQQLPTHFFESLAFLGEDAQIKAHALFGDTVSLKASGQLEKNLGSFAIDLSSPKSALSAKGRLEGTDIRLTEALKGQLLFTPEFGRVWLEPHLPLFSTCRAAQKPLTLKIEPENFLWSYTRNDLCQLGSGRLELNTITLENSGQLQILLQLLRAETDTQTIDFTFTPIDFSCHDGIFYVERFDALIASLYHVATWGNYSLPSDIVTMTLGISGPTLRRALFIENLRDNYFLLLPLQGPSSDVRLDVAVASAKIASLTAMGSSQAHTQALGSFFNAVLDASQNDAIPPLKEPLPWNK